MYVLEVGVSFFVNAWSLCAVLKVSECERRNEERESKNKEEGGRVVRRR